MSSISGAAEPVVDEMPESEETLGRYAGMPVSLQDRLTDGNSGECTQQMQALCSDGGDTIKAWPKPQAVLLQGTYQHPKHG